MATTGGPRECPDCIMGIHMFPAHGDYEVCQEHRSWAERPGYRLPMTEAERRDAMTDEQREFARRMGWLDRE